MQRRIESYKRQAHQTVSAPRGLSRKTPAKQRHEESRHRSVGLHPTAARNVYRSPSVCAIVALLLVLIAVLAQAQPAQAQASTTCGIVDELRMPVENPGLRNDNFREYRARFGGLHTGFDMAFGQYGEPVRAIARGRVTYADPEGWDTEKGVVIIEHLMPDGEVVYSLYGHMEPLFDYFFPAVGQCVEAGSIVGAIGRPSLSAPHLHLEIRTFGPGDGGPGHWNTNPLEAGWLHPLDFMMLWQTRFAGQNSELNPYVSHVTGLDIPSMPPVILADGGLVTASGSLLEGVRASGGLTWRLEFSNTVTGFIALPDGRILSRMRSNTILITNGGRYEVQWSADRPLSDGPYWFDGAAVFLSANNELVAYTPEGQLLWSTSSLGDRIGDMVMETDRMLVGTRPLSSDIAAAWRIIGPGGERLYEVGPNNPPIAAFGPQGDYYLLDGDMLYHISADFVPTPLVRLPESAERNAAMISDAVGNVYIFPGGTGQTLYAYDAAGEPLWDSRLSIAPNAAQAPLLAAGPACLIYALDAEGDLYALRDNDGTQVGEAHLYAGSAQPNARILQALPNGQVRFGAGHLSILTLDGYALTGVNPQTCESLLTISAAE